MNCVAIVKAEKCANCSFVKLLTFFSSALAHFLLLSSMPPLIIKLPNIWPEEFLVHPSVPPPQWYVGGWEGGGWRVVGVGGGCWGGVGEATACFVTVHSLVNFSSLHLFFSHYFEFIFLKCTHAPTFLHFCSSWLPSPFFISLLSFYLYFFSIPSLT